MIILEIIWTIIKSFVLRTKTPEQKTIEAQDEQIKIVANRDNPNTDDKLHTGKF